MKKHLITFVLLLSFGFLYGQPKREVRAVWLTTNYGLDWPRNKYWGTAAQDLMIDMLDRLQAAHFNTVIFQVQSLGDVWWSSNIQPWSKVVTGKYGQAPQYDVCQFVIDECHKRGMEVHAWIVPYRLGTKANADGYEASTSNHRHVINLHPELCIEHGDGWYLDPGLPAVRSYLLDLYEELVTSTNFDGINLDYTRYPDAAFKDDASFAAHNPNKLSKADWRRDNINQFVYSLYDMIKKHRPDMKIGAAPIGTYKNLPGKGNLEAYGDVFQDACQWMKQGKHDLLLPQMYWTETVGYSANMDVWIDNSASRQLAIGLAAYKMTDYNKWEHTVITDQIEKARQKGTEGVCFFRTDNITGTGANYVEVEKLYNVLKTDHFKYPAHIPVMDYNGVSHPGQPRNLTMQAIAENNYTLSWAAPEVPAGARAVRYYCVYAQEGNSVDITDPAYIVGYAVQGTSFTYKAPQSGLYTFAVTTFDKGYYESEPALSSTEVALENTPLAILDWAVDQYTFHLKTSKTIESVALYTLSGQLALSSAENGNDIRVDISHLQQGVYVAKVLLEGNIVRQFKIVYTR